MTAPAPRPAVSDSGPGGRRRISPGLVILLIALIGSIAYVVYAITVRDASQIPLLASGAVVLAIAFAALTVYSFGAVLRSGRDGRGGRAIVLAFVGGGAAIATAGCLAAAFVLFRLASGG